MSKRDTPDMLAPNPYASALDAIRHTDVAGDYWMARELMTILDYATWYTFLKAIQRAMADCARAGWDVTEHFQLKVKRTGKPGRSPQDYRLSLYACHLIAMNAKTPGAAQTRAYLSVLSSRAKAIVSSKRS